MARLSRVIAQGAGLTLACLMLAGCVTRPTGDFGRAAPDVIHDRILPAAGAHRARYAGEPVSGFNQSDEEREMHDRVWRFLTAPHARDWMFDAAVELQRTRLTGPTDLSFEINRYHHWLVSTRFGSSRTRYNRIADDVKADMATIPATFAIICRVIEIDRQRAIALGELGRLTANAGPDVRARRAENDAHIAWFARALDYRYQSYRFALDNLLVETPHAEVREVDALLNAMAPDVALAMSGRFCGGLAFSGDGSKGVAPGVSAGPIPSRYGRPYSGPVVPK
ncbi:hypothetical protein EMQ25_09065 [Arsenicitalea aurantiaca]|uniref:Uncharacterized protein n=1 Tax=Arsenicitalea aurantiaca TaxID=1783274 RepID=A0A433XAC2_9HYPH|nr:hypothetical protein [Arsenicitalea aurantiaca]RUT31019.1 hypothetical protein EMQ25_09065 [Arsenicitalea aurantiaca]